MKKQILKISVILFVGLFQVNMVLAQSFGTNPRGLNSYDTNPYGSSPYGSPYGSVSGMGGIGGMGGGMTIPNTGLPNNSNGVAGVLSNVLLWLLAVVGTLAVIAFVISGIQYLTSAGDEKNIETAKRNLTYSIVGIVVALSGLIILTTINMILSGTAPSAGGGGGNPAIGM